MTGTTIVFLAIAIPTLANVAGFVLVIRTVRGSTARLENTVGESTAGLENIAETTERIKECLAGGDNSKRWGVIGSELGLCPDSLKILDQTGTTELDSKTALECAAALICLCMQEENGKTKDTSNVEYVATREVAIEKPDFRRNVS